MPRHSQRSTRGRDSYKQGRIADYIALFYLFLKGYKFIKSRYRNKSGEIDLLMYKKRQLIIIEIKAGRNITSRDWHPVSAKQQRRIKNAATIFYHKNQSRWRDGMRFDVILINTNFLPPSFPIKHFKNEF